MFSKLPIDSFVCQNPDCPDFHRQGRSNVQLRRYYSSQRRRLLKCRTCGSEFSELKGTPYWNAKSSPETIDDVIDHIAHGNCFKSTAELVGCHRTTVARITRVAGVHAEHFHDLNARKLEVTSIQADERYGFVGDKSQPAWDATVTHPKSKFLIAGDVGARTGELTRRILTEAKERLADPHGIVLFTDGFVAYEEQF